MERFVHGQGEELQLDDVSVIIDGDEKWLGSLKLDIPSGKLILLPPRWVRMKVTPFVQEELVIIGGRTAIIPAEMHSGEEILFYKTLLRFLDEEDAYRDGRMVVEVLSEVNTEDGGPSRFRLVRSDRKNGYLCGMTEVEYGPEGKRLTMSIHQYVPAPHLTESVKRGDSVEQDLIVYRERDLLSLPENTVSGRTLENRVFTFSRDLAGGSLLTSSYLEGQPGVRAGDPVTVVFRKGNITLEVSGRARSTGEIGDRIDVIPAGREGRRFEGLITGFREVEIELP